MRLIDVDKLKDIISDTWVLDRIDEQPTVDAVPVVRCKDCKYTTIDNDVIRYILLFNPMTYFCNGYRKALLYHQWYFEGFYRPDYENLIFVAEFVLVVLLGFFNYNRLKKRLPDVL